MLIELDESETPLDTRLRLCWVIIGPKNLARIVVHEFELRDCGIGNFHMQKLYITQNPLASLSNFFYTPWVEISTHVGVAQLVRAQHS